MKNLLLAPFLLAIRVQYILSSFLIVYKHQFDLDFLLSCSHKLFNELFNLLLCCVVGNVDYDPIVLPHEFSRHYGLTRLPFKATTSFCGHSINHFYHLNFKIPVFEFTKFDTLSILFYGCISQHDAIGNSKYLILNIKDIFKCVFKGLWRARHVSEGGMLYRRVWVS